MNDEDENFDHHVRQILRLPEPELKPEPEIDHEPDWSSQQRVALNLVEEWLNNPRSDQIFRLFGFAGTGKTTLAKYLARKHSVAFAAYTGKAAAVMRKSGCKGATTIDRLIYKPTISGYCLKVECKPPCIKVPWCDLYREKWLGRTLKVRDDVPHVKLFIIDECSMVDYDMAMDLMSFGIKILVLGDPGQLQPIGGEGYFTDASPDYMLTEIHRQASGSPIITLATHVRKGGKLERGRYGNCLVTHIHTFFRNTVLEEYDQILCGTHKVRCSLIKQLRMNRGYTNKVPMVGEKVVCLRNNHFLGIYNGTIWTVTDTAKSPEDGFITIEIVEEDTIGPIHTVTAPIEGFLVPHGNGGELPGAPFAFADALTVHKAQGSQWKSVCIYDDSDNIAFRAMQEGEYFDTSRWLYTAITRASERLAIGQIK